MNEKSTSIFRTLVENLKDGYLKIYNEPFMPLTIEQIGACGDAKLYSICHYYEQNGDLMQDPEMCFATIGNGDVGVYPYLFQQANMSVYEESIRFSDNDAPKCKQTLQMEHMAFANEWLKNIKLQGFLKQLEDGNV